MISVIVPVRGEAPPEARLLTSLLAQGVELLVAAEETIPEPTAAAWERGGARLLRLSGNRGARVRSAAALARGEVLLFAHADTRLPDGWSRMVADAVAAGAVGGAFRLAFEGGGPAMAWVAAWANLRTALTRVPYGDQAPFVRKDVWDRLGGYPPWPLLEEVEFGGRLRREGRIAILPATVRTSPRRYQSHGVLRTVLMNWRILWRYRRGVSVDALAEEYRRASRPRGDGQSPPTRA